jgi:flagellar hook-basal body complex protein FliE
LHHESNGNQSGPRADSRALGTNAGAPGGGRCPSSRRQRLRATLLRQGVAEVNQSEQRSSELATAFERGTPGVELPQVMLEMQKASVSFRALTEVRNRLVTAYQDIMNMPM